MEKKFLIYYKEMQIFFCIYIQNSIYILKNRLVIL